MVRKSILSGSWYPDDKIEIDSLLQEWTAELTTERRTAGVAPHAGWYYSGKTAAGAVKQVCIDKDLIVVVGGHLPPGSSILAAFEDRVSVPSGTVKNRVDLINDLKKTLKICEDIFSDNTVEIVLAMVVAFAPDADIMWLRAPADMISVRLAEELYNLTEKKGCRTGIIGSTDLTHYGSSYSFQPEGRGAKAVEWVKNVNDAGFIKLLLELDYEKALEHANKNRSACSAGAAAAAARFADLNGINRGELTNYITSYDVRPAESFVGYAGIVY